MRFSAIILGLSISLGSATFAMAGECSTLCQGQFYQTATPADIDQQLAEGADINGQDDVGRSPLHFVAQASSDTIAAMLAAGAEVSSEDSLQRQPIHFVSATAAPEVVDVLLQAGADPNARTANDWTLLHGAAKWGRADTIALLLASGAEAGAINEMGEMPYDLIGGNTRVVDTPEFELLRQAKED